ncbi:MAG: hypothetical protein HY800_02805 [Ignavibacteriales bacterium]|nr:hypothetical protein [Ignavibacteriales bacterium]
MSHNLYDMRTNIKIIATPYYPSVILAIQRISQGIYHWSEEDYRMNVDALMKDNAGLYVDWAAKRFMDSRGNYYRDKLQIDSLMFLITIQNRAWPCGTMITYYVGGMFGGEGFTVPLYGSEHCYMPEITNLEDRIFLVNENNKFIKPRYVWGKRHNVLTMEETLLAMFYLSRGEDHFLAGSDEMYLLVKGFERDIKLTYSLSMMR